MRKVLVFTEGKEARLLETSDEQMDYRYFREDDGETLMILFIERFIVKYSHMKDAQVYEVATDRRLSLKEVVEAAEKFGVPNVA